ncbi:FMN-binding protein [Streptomyces sp. SID13666]|uniref:FMN-binding protein n=1 Tax=unclassified Streptomyces TaxID=2593676 RepID=UPI0013C1AC54|nr:MULTISPECIES: FMN-binding protein [unclassified Streptomyces]NEA52664.1 FMN-binding protein [Streptomyces sp. SID13666]NEA70009.1 FMN-binding protein [Streptomyces sp. SID13588]
MRTHPLRRIVLSAAATVTGVVLLLSLKPHAQQQSVAQQNPNRGSSPAAAGSAPSASAGSTSGGVRTVDGDTIQTRFGPVQVRITLTGSKITAVTVLQVPDENGRDQEIAEFSVPLLTQEALDAQSAGIDTVSGATYTSEGYIRSLQSALDRSGG